MSKVSVIIPVYNTENYLKRCLDSVINQTLQDIEIICVNDGSKDNSLAILEEYAQKDSRIKVIDQKNQGVCVARNKGLEIAGGEYVCFCDSDDYIELDLLTSCLNESDSDIIIYGNRRIKNGEMEDDNLFFVHEYNKNKNYDTILHIMHAVWDKLYKRSFLDEHNIYFRSGLRTAEDGVFCINCLKYHPSITAIEKVFYNYIVTNAGSAINRHNMVETELETLKYLIKSDIYQDLEDGLKILSVNKFVMCITDWYNHPEMQKYRRKNEKLIIDMKKFLQKNVEPSILAGSYFYNERMLPIKIERHKLLKQIFSIYNSPDKRHKILTILGIKIKFKRKYKTER